MRFSRVLLACAALLAGCDRKDSEAGGPAPSPSPAPTKPTPAPVPKPAPTLVGVDFTPQAQLLFRVAACASADPLPAHIDAAAVD
ncbi:MAG TPA: hypothetical protein VL172_03645, partial [Kofleriaceae bacterium]|nr:hypothetical protein [Kofleriaceae bacterium]